MNWLTRRFTSRKERKDVICCPKDYIGKIQEIGLSKNGIAKNILSFNIGVEIGQFLALSVAIMLFLVWQKRDSFSRQAFAVNTFIMFCGFTLAGYHLIGYVLWDV